MPIDSIIQAAFVAIAVIVILLFFVFSMLLEGTLKKKRLLPTEDETELNQANDETEEFSAVIEEEKKPEQIPIYEKYPVIYRFEILYWRAVSKPWWWNNYAKDLVEYAGEYFPWNRVEFYSTFNSNSKSTDSVDMFYQDRIRALRPHKRSKHPLVVINYDEEFIMVDSSYALEEMKDRIDAEWYRQYQFKKTYRNSPLFFTK